MAEPTMRPDRSQIAFIGDYLPRRCGLATFTHDLSTAVASAGQDSHQTFVLAVNDVPEGYPYPEMVRFEMRETVQADYRLAADFLNIQNVSAVCLQHEYGIYGGASGAHVLALLQRLRRPLVTTLHTVLQKPTDEQRAVLQEIGRLSDRVVVMSEVAQGMLDDIYDIPAEKVVTIPHGIPDVPFVDPNFYKDQFGVEGRKVMLTFGLLSPGKGIEYVIEALPEIIKEHPEVVYILLGATHPHVKRKSGEEYRNGLARRATELGVADHIMFVNRFVEISELVEYLGSADLYVTPYLTEQQIVSGTLAYALGAGKAMISTPYWYAKEMLADQRGRIVPFREAGAIAEQVNDLLDNEVERHAMRKRAYTHCRKMIWKRVAQDYLDLFQTATEAWVEKQHTRMAVPAPRSPRLDELPEVDLRHLHLLTDDCGILQHAIFSTPDRSGGYSTDDNARALIAAAMHWDHGREQQSLELIQKHLAFLAHAMDDETGRFRTYVNYDRSFSDIMGSEDSHARALWGLGTAVALCPHESMIALATRLFLRGLGATEPFASPRAWAYTIVGIHAYLRRFGGDSGVRRCRADLAERLFRCFADHADDDWPWFEDTVTYANAKLPHALIMAGKWMNRDEMIDMGKRALSWLFEVQTNDDGLVSLVGTEGWLARGKDKALFEQKPIEAHALVDACIEAYHVTREPFWVQQAHKAFNWFLGDNDLRTPLHDFTTGGCRDGLHADRVNENQGAEATLAWLMSLLLMHGLQMEQTLGDLRADMSEKHPTPVTDASERTPDNDAPRKARKVRKYAGSDRHD